MLNKEMLLLSQVNSATNNIVELQIGDGGVGDYGYCGSTRWGFVPCGTLDRIPYWYGSIDAYFALDLLNEIYILESTLALGLALITQVVEHLREGRNILLR